MFIIRNITPEDYDETIEMIKLSIRVSFQNLYPMELIREFCNKYDLEQFEARNNEIDYLVALDEVNKAIIGIIGLKNNRVRTFFVHPSYQGKGVGRQLFNHLEHIAKSKHLLKFTVEASPIAAMIYEHFGFVRTGSKDKERNGIPYTDILLEKDLRPTEIEKRLS